MSIAQLSYRLEFASGVWRDIGILPRQAYDRITDQLSEIADDGASLQSDSSLQRLDAGELSALYEVDHAAQMVVVFEVFRRSEMP